jgi:glycosyltransferase involved in cell wall biosynthesis
VQFWFIKISNRAYIWSLFLVLLIFPSIREFGGGVILEAMALGIVPLVVDYAGPGELVDASVGYKIPIGSRAEIVAAFHDGLAMIAADPGVLSIRSKAARRLVVEHYTWDAKALKIRAVYDWVLAATDARPELNLDVALSTNFGYGRHDC